MVYFLIGMMESIPETFFYCKTASLCACDSSIKIIKFHYFPGAFFVFLGLSQGQDMHVIPVKDPSPISNAVL